jgi:hypothetical protein
LDRFFKIADPSFGFGIAARAIDIGKTLVIYKHKDAHYAKKFGRSIRTIQHWRSVGAPLDDGSAMGAFIRLKELNRTGGKRPISEMKAPEISAEELAAVKRGAEAALQRLTDQEARCSAELSAAQSQGADQQLVGVLMDRWLKVSGELRSFNLAIEKFRKETGEIIQRDKVAAAFGWVALWFKIAADRLHTHGPVALAGITEPDQLQKRLDAELCKAFWGSLHEASKRAAEDLDVWACKTMINALHSRGFAPTDA